MYLLNKEASKLHILTIKFDDDDNNKGVRNL